MDLDFDGPSKPPPSSRAARFAPKNSKLKPQPKPEPEPEPEPLTDPTIPSKKEEIDSKPLLTLENGSSAPSIDTEKADVEVQQDVAMEIVESGEDEVVREIDMYFTPSLDPNTQLYVLQSPMRPVWRPYELEERCKEVRLRPTTAQMEVDLAIDFDSKNFDRDSIYAEKMEKQTVSTSWIPVPTGTSGYAVGVLIGDKLHLNPIHTVVQLRPSKQHLKESELKKNIATSNDEKTVENEEIKENKPVAPSKKQNKPPGNDKDIEEHWVHLKYHGARSEISARYLQRMAMEEGSPIPFSMSLAFFSVNLIHRVDYLRTLCPGRPNDTDKYKDLRIRVSQLPLDERFRTWLHEGPPIHRFGALKHLALDNPVEEILEVLQRYAQVVQGLWVPKSSLVYGRNDGHEVLARDFVLFEFSKSPFIKQSVFDRKPEFFKAATPALKLLAVERPDLNDWKLKEHPDKEFENLYGDLVKEQQVTWERLGKQIYGLLAGGRNRPTMKNPSNPSAGIPALPSGGKPTPRSVTRTSMSERTREALQKALQKVFRTHKVCSFQQIRLRLREAAVSENDRPKGNAKGAVAAASFVDDAPPEELQAVIDQVAFNIHGDYVLKSSPDNPQYDALRKVVVELLIGEGPSAKLKKATIMKAAKSELNRDIPPAEFQKVKFFSYLL
uniref:DNA-directed RNA polymerase III subunit RPC5 n=1 Tax=Petunia integrifolia subsp. inflata TaxID=212142 RepID=A9XLE9_PETIN|nr:unknown [Petunia integrifolia subsp. inflata]